MYLRIRMLPPLVSWLGDMGGPVDLSSPAIVQAYLCSGAEAPVSSFLHYAGCLVC